MKSTKESIAAIRKALQSSIPCSHENIETSEGWCFCNDCGARFPEVNKYYFKRIHLEHFEAIELLDIAAEDLIKLGEMEMVAEKMEKMRVLKKDLEKRTIGGYLLELHEPCRSQAICNTDDEKLTVRASSLTDALNTAFHWAETPQGEQYWEDLYDSLTQLK